MTLEELELVREALNKLHQRTFNQEKDARIKALWERMTYAAKRINTTNTLTKLTPEEQKESLNS